MCDLCRVSSLYVLFVCLVYLYYVFVFVLYVLSFVCECSLSIAMHIMRKSQCDVYKLDGI